MRKWLNQLRRHLGCRLRWAHWTVCLIAVLTSQGRGNCGVSGPLESIWDFLRHIMQRTDHHCHCQLQCFQHAGITLNSPMKNQSHLSTLSAFTLLAGRQEEHPSCKNWVMRCWCGYMSGARYRLFAYGPADATASLSSLALFKSRLVLPFGTGLPRLSWKRRR